jgi:multifunctional beta-oxidation protein
MLTFSYALFFASRGSSVVVNDVSEKAAQAVVDEIKKGKSAITLEKYANQIAGGKAAIAPGSVADGKKVIDAAVKAFGTVHILINNAGIIRKLSSRIVLTALMIR